VKIRTLIGDDAALARHTLSLLLDAERHFEISGECAALLSAPVPPYGGTLRV